MSEETASDKNVEIWKVKKLIKSLQLARGNGTSMISLIIPPGDQVVSLNYCQNQILGSRIDFQVESSSKILDQFDGRIKWVSEYGTSLIFKWLKRGWKPNGTVFECHLKIGQSNHLNAHQIDIMLFSYVLVQYSDGWSST